jgi:hypothetical protein
LHAAPTAGRRQESSPLRAELTPRTHASPLCMCSVHSLLPNGGTALLHCCTVALLHCMSALFFPMAAHYTAARHYYTAARHYCTVALLHCMSALFSLKRRCTVALVRAAMCFRSSPPSSAVGSPTRLHRVCRWRGHVRERALSTGSLMAPSHEPPLGCVHIMAPSHEPPLGCVHMV